MEVTTELDLATGKSHGNGRIHVEKLMNVLLGHGHFHGFLSSCSRQVIKKIDR